MNFKIKKRPVHHGYWLETGGYSTRSTTEFVLYKLNPDKAEEQWDYISSFPSDEAAEDFAKQYKAIAEEREFQL